MFKMQTYREGILHLNKTNNANIYDHVLKHRELTNTLLYKLVSYF